MMGRRDFMLGCVSVKLAAASSYLPSCTVDRLAFRAMRNGSDIGTHVLEFIPRADGVDIRVAVNFKVNFGPVTLFRYHLQGVEQWRNGLLTSAEFSANNNGKVAFMHCRREKDTLIVAGSGVEEYRAPAKALPASHWNPAELDGPWINTENGKLLEPQVTAKGTDTLHAADGAALAAKHYVLSGEVRMELWYDAENRWAALSFTADDDSIVRYQRV